MEKLLWAPWRIEYIEKEKEEGCIFCKRVKEKNDEKNLIVYRGKHSFVIMNRYPYNSGHVMVVPYLHIGFFEDLPDEVLNDMNSTLKRTIKALSAALGPDGFNMGINQGKAAGAGVTDHVHIHVVPRWIGDTNFMPVISDTRVVPEYLERTYRKIKEYF